MLLEPHHYSRELAKNPCADEPCKIVVILNPMAGRGRARKGRSELEHVMERSAHDARERSHRTFQWSIVETTAAGAGTALARQAADAGANVVVAAGGDGTLNEVVNGIVGTQAILGVLPFGTGNDFVRCRGVFGDCVDWRQFIPVLFTGAPRPVDLGKVGDRWFINIAGCGFDALVAERINQGFRYLKGTTAYIAAVCDCLRTLKSADLRITLDGKVIETRALMCSVANATSYGGGMMITPDARIDDGLFDICLLHEAGRLEFLRAFPRVFKGTHVTHPKVTMLRAREVEVASEPPLPILIDGDVTGMTPVTFTNHKHMIRVLAPQTPPTLAEA